MLTSAAARGALARGRISGSSTRVCTKNSKLGSAWSGLGGLRTINARKRCFSQSVPRLSLHLAAAAESKKEGDRRELSTGSASAGDAEEKARPEHAVISTFDLFSIGGTSCPSRLEPRALRKRVLIRMFDISVYPRQSMGDYDVDMKYTLFPGFIGVMLWNGMCGSGSE